ncbi:Uu.00g043390.m01.CDS01 [Anthostomella pinea]|uniref:Uu.00g043390.m01.CDS01 n=1 Tax=Anthostomella pinea TaxID=933095 RepID=A0AAI8VAS3_9PEZI|nr:Uu.00g043390.m01.CDS01 [Anthostomella pinea]
MASLQPEALQPEALQPEALQPEALQPEALQPRFQPGKVSDYLLQFMDSNAHSDRLIVSIDFGTTNSCVSYAAIPKDNQRQVLGRDAITPISNYPDDLNSPDDTSQMKNQVPSELLYPNNRDFRQKLGLKLNDETQASCSNPANDSVRGHPASTQSESGSDSDIDMFEIANASFHWGCGVQQARTDPVVIGNLSNKAISLFKLMLDKSPTTKLIRDNLQPTLRSLRRREIVDPPHFAIADYLACMLRHVKSELQAKGTYDNYEVELVLCVPAIWSQKACRDMQAALTAAMRMADFKGLDTKNDCIENLFIVSEPEAAAAFVLDAHRSVNPGDTILLLDAGGGTVDANTYRVSQTTPLRLTEEVVPPGGDLCGSSFLNQAFRKELRRRLDGEKYLEFGEVTLDTIVDHIVLNEFEYKTKRKFDMYDKHKKYERYEIGGLRKNKEKDFMDNSLYVRSKDLKNGIFMGLLQRIASIMEDQIKQARQKEVPVDKVILIGGFAASPSLRRYLEERLAGISREYGHGIEMIVGDHDVTAVASGAVLRAMNKERGPQRFARASYGILRRESHGDWPSHIHAAKTRDKVDGFHYVNTIDWVLPRGTELESVWQCEPFACIHTFPQDAETLGCEEVLYVSDTATLSHWPVNKGRNKGAEKVGEIRVDFTFLKDRGLIRLERSTTEEGVVVGEWHYKVHYTMVIKLVDRDLQCFAIYDGRVVKKCRINIASGFLPGVK